MTTAQDHIRDALDRAQKAFTSSLDPNAPNFREASGWFIHHVCVAVLLEHLRRANPNLADQLTDWMLTQDGIFSDGYAGELLYQWREQLAAGQPMDPIGPELEPPADPPSSARKPCPEGFHWVGQPFTSCNLCGLPAWEHAGVARLAPVGGVLQAEFVLDPWAPGQAELVKAKWAPDAPIGPTTEVTP